MAVRQMKLLGNMLGAEIDFVILGIDSKSAVWLPAAAKP